jgi:hypothetical protein
MKSDYRWLLAVLVLFGVLFAIKALGEQGRLGRWSFTKSVDVKSAGDNRATYYRLKVNLAYKGEPLDFDIVVGCHVRITTYKDNDRAVEVGVAPMVFGLKMKDGHGVVVRPPEACGGETTENGKVPKALLPLIATYENANAPRFGIAYASEDAYDSPLSQLKFFGASISKATREEWQQWRRTEAPKNFVTYELLGINEESPWDFPRWKPGYRVMASNCLGDSWVKLPESVREVIRGYWPSDKPAYWYPNGDTRRALSVALRRQAKDQLVLDGNQFDSYNLPSLGAEGVPRRQPGAEIRFADRVVGDVYPARTDLSLNQLGSDGELPLAIKAKSKLSWSEAEVRPDLRGFAYCDATIFRIAGVPDRLHDNTAHYVNLINGVPIGEELEIVTTNTDFAFERDEYVVFSRTYQLGDIFGGL